METQEVSGYWMLIIADTLLLADTALRYNNKHQENYYAEEKKNLNFQKNQFNLNLFLKEMNSLYRSRLNLSLHKYMLKHLKQE